MASKKANDEMFIEGAIRTVAEVGIENLRTQDVAVYSGFSEATLFRHFETKEILLRASFLHIDKKISDLLTKGGFIDNYGTEEFPVLIHRTWKKIYRYLLEHVEETIFLVRYRYSSLYTKEVREKREAYNGNFDRIYEIFDRVYGKEKNSYQGFLINFIFEMTLCFAEKIITEKAGDTKEAEDRIWLAISGVIDALTGKQGEIS